MVLKLPIEIDEKDLMKHLEKAVKECLDERALLGFIRDEIKRVFSQTKRVETTMAIGQIKARLTRIEDKINGLEDDIIYIRRKLRNG